MYQLRPYQEKARDAVLWDWRNGYRRTLLTLPTGTGKTIVFASIVESQVKRSRRVLIMAHRDELLSQASEKLRAATGLESVLEKAERSSLDSSIPVTVGSVQSLAKESRLSRFPKDRFDDIIVDEAHHCLSDSYQRVLEHFPGANVLGVTATPDRGDMKDLGSYFEHVAYEYSLKDAVKEGYLCPIIAKMIPLQLDLTKVRTVCGDYQDKDLGNALEPYLEQIADEMVANCQGRKTLVFLPLIATSQRFRDILKSKGMRAAEVNGTSPDRKEILADFEAGKYDVLCNSMLLTEGWDCPSLDCVVVLRPTKIRSLYVQMVGRGTRTCPGKENLLLLDFLWMTTKHSLCRPSALIGKTEDDQRRIDKIVEEEPVDILEAAKRAESDKVKEARENALAQSIKANEKKQRRTIDVLEASVYIAPDLIDYEPVFGWEEDAPTEKQLSTLKRFGINPSSIASKGQASVLLDTLIKRAKANLATPAQAKWLAWKGYDTNMTKKEASAIMDAWAANSWKRPQKMSL